MKAPECCQIGKQAGGHHRRPSSAWRRGGEIAGWLLPTATLALLPKCPACVAAYVALATGIGISMPTAAFLRTSVLTISIISLLVLIIKKRSGFRL